jgi:pimeloyl-ACP methyl ester carboxylesterase
MTRAPRPTPSRHDQGQLAFRVWTSGDGEPGTPFVLVHGIGASHRYLARLHDALRPHGPVYSVDLPGYGGLPRPDTDVDVETMSRALGVVLTELGVAGAVVVGHSMGAQWVVELAVQRPDLAAHVVVIGPVTDEAHRSLAAQAAALAMDSLGETPRINAIVFTDYLRCGIRWYLLQSRHMLAYPIEERVRELSMPLLVMRGERDPIAGLRWCRRLRDEAPVAELVLIPGRYHVAQFSSPGAVAAAILAHVRTDAVA